MLVKQLSVFVENKPGRLSAIINLLAEHHVNLSALSLADTSSFGAEHCQGAADRTCRA